MIPEPPPGTIVRFSTGMYSYAAIHIGPRPWDATGRGIWYTTTAFESDDPEWSGLPMQASWEEIVRFAEGRRIQKATAWETIQDGRGPKEASGVDWS